MNERRLEFPKVDAVPSAEILPYVTTHVARKGRVLNESFRNKYIHRYVVFTIH